MPSFVIIAIACAVAVGQTAATSPLEQSVARVLLTFGSMLVSCMMARIMVVACQDVGIDVDQLIYHRHKARHRSRWERWHLLVWLCMSAFLLFGLGWGTVVRTNWGLGSTILLDELVILTPLLLPWLVSWGYFYELEHPSKTTSQSIQIRQRWKFAAQHARIVFGLGLLPVLTVCLVSDLARYISPELNGKPIPTSFFLAPMALLVVGYPLLLRRLWKTIPFPAGKLRQAMDAFSSQSGIRVRETYLWDTNGKSLNAAVTGALPQLRYLFFTDRIVNELPQDEILAAMAHEYGHVRHGHLVVRMTALFFPITLIIAVGTLSNWIFQTTDVTSSAPNVSLSPELIAFATVVTSVLYLWQVIGGYSRRLELQADVEGWRLLSAYFGCETKAADTYTSMLKRISSRHDQRGGWLHPPIARRIDAIEQAAINPRSSIRWDRGLGALRIVLHVTTLAAVITILIGA